MADETPWYREFFRGIAMDSWEAAIPDVMTEQEVEMLVDVIDPPDGGRLLDVPCGRGRHAFRLAERGYAITGVDVCGENIERNRRRGEGLPMRWVEGDMTAFAPEQGCAGAYCLGNSFGYAPPGQTQEFLRRVRASLVEGAGFVLDTAMAAESVLPSLGRHDWAQVGDIYLLMEREYVVADSRMDLTYTFVRDGQMEVREAQHWVFTVREIQEMCAAAGLRVMELFSGADRRPYRVNDVRLFLHAVAE